MTTSLGVFETERLDALLQVRDGRTDFNRIKDTPRPATLQHLRQWTQRLNWLESILPSELEEQMLAVFADVLDQTIQTPEDNATLGQGVRNIF